jgi:hypothetical protein
MFRAGVDPLRFAFLAPRKPSVAFRGHPGDLRGARYEPKVFIESTS